VKTWAIFAPLFAKVPTQEEAEFVVKNYLLNKDEFKTKYMLPTVSKSEPSYDPEHYWRGPVWIAINWILYQGLLNYKGFLKKLPRIFVSRALSFSRNRGFSGNTFNPETGGGLGAKNFHLGRLNSRYVS